MIAMSLILPPLLTARMSANCSRLERDFGAVSTSFKYLTLLAWLFSINPCSTAQSKNIDSVVRARLIVAGF